MCYCIRFLFILSIRQEMFIAATCNIGEDAVIPIQYPDIQQAQEVLAAAAVITKLLLQIYFKELC